jgi:hypothetical protein
MRVGEKSFGNNAVLPVITAEAFENENWFDGPNNNWNVASDRVWQYMPCTAADVPAASSSYVAVGAS